jgi:hypothetical protein
LGRTKGLPTLESRTSESIFLFKAPIFFKILRKATIKYKLIIRVQKKHESSFFYKIQTELSKISLLWSVQREWDEVGLVARNDEMEILRKGLINGQL